MFLKSKSSARVEEEDGGIGGGGGGYGNNSCNKVVLCVSKLLILKSVKSQLEKVVSNKMESKLYNTLADWR